MTWLGLVWLGLLLQLGVTFASWCYFCPKKHVSRNPRPSVEAKAASSSPVENVANDGQMQYLSTHNLWGYFC